MEIPFAVGEACLSLADHLRVHLVSMPRRVYIQQNCIAHYRRAIFEGLSSSQRYEFVVITDTKPDTPFLELADLSSGTVHHRFARNYIFSLPFVETLFWQPGAVWMALRDSPAAIIALGNPYSLTAWSLLLIGRLQGIPVLLWSHGLLKDETGPKWWVRRLLYRLATGHLLYGEHAKSLLITKGFPATHLHVVYNSLDHVAQQKIDRSITDQERIAFRTSLAVQADHGLVAFTGRLQPVKRLDLLFEAIRILGSRGRVVHAAVVGKGAQQPVLEELCRTLGIQDRIHFLGESYDDRFLGLVLGSSDLCVIPSGAGLSIMHALAFGTPVVLHDRTAEHFPEWEAVKDGVTGFYYRYGDTEDLATKIEQAIFPHTRKRDLAQACRDAIANRYNPRTQVTLIEDAVTASLTFDGSTGNAPEPRPQ